jgi:hypothetical protein
VAIYVGAASFSWSAVGGAQPRAQDSSFLSAWDACWTCSGALSAPAEGDALGERTALGAADVGGRLDLADVLGAEASEGTLTVHFVDRASTRGDEHKWEVQQLCFAGSAPGSAAGVADALRAVLRGPAFRCRPRKLLVREKRQLPQTLFTALTPRRCACP